MIGNDLVALVLRTPLHVLMGKTILITVTGRKTGKKYTTPVGYYRADDHLWVITSRDRTWWRNVKDGANVQIRIHGRDMTGYAEAILDEDSIIERLGDYLKQTPMASKPLGIRVENGMPHPEDAARLAKERLFVKISVVNYPLA